MATARAAWKSSLSFSERLTNIQNLYNSPHPQFCQYAATFSEANSIFRTVAYRQASSSASYVEAQSQAKRQEGEAFDEASSKVLRLAPFHVAFRLITTY